MKTIVYILIGLCSLLFTTPTRAEVIIRITEGVEAGIPVMVVPFQGGNLASIIEEDLLRSGRFTLVDPIQAGQALSMGQPFQTPLLRASGAEYVILGRQSGSLEFEVIHAATGNRAAGFRIPQHRNQRRMAHKAADLIFERLTGIKGAFNTHLAYVEAHGPARAQTYKLVVSDSDGHNPRVVLASAKPIMSPSWSPDARQLAYVSYESGRSAIYVQDLTSGQKSLLSSHEGMNAAPAWSPNGRYLALSLSERGNADIHVLDMQSGQVRPITRSRAIDTEPAWANNTTLVYTSDQSGNPQLYRTSLGGGDGTRLTFQGNYNSAPSVVGNSIAMVRDAGNGFRIVLMNASSKKSVNVSPGSYDESPSLAPNGTMVVYATGGSGRGTLAVSSANGKAQQILPIQAGDVRDPAWSPYLD